MPKLRPETKKIRAAKVIKSYTENGFNQSATALAEGVSQPAINKKLKNPLVISALDKAFKKVGINTSYKARKFKELLEANKVISARITSKDADVDTDDFIDVPDNPTRVTTLRLLCQVQGDIKVNDKDTGNKIAIIQINYGHRANNNGGHSPIRQEGGQVQSA